MNTRTECSPRIIKRIKFNKKIDDAAKYEFYRQINHLSIIKLDNEADKMNYSSWLIRLDSETSDLKMHLIKILFISLRSDKSFQMFLKPPPDDLNDLELRSDNTMDMIKWLQDHNIDDESLTSKEKKQEIKHKRSAAVATNMRSYTTTKTSPYFVQSFYVRSDWPIYIWYNPTSILLPSSFNHNQWELFLNRFQFVTEDKNSSKHRNECDDIIPIDQISNEVTTTFNWHPYSILGNEENRPKRTAGSIVLDLDIANQQCNQQQIDEAAFSIVFCKLFPGNKIISQRMYSDTLIPEAKFIFKMTGVTLVDYSNVKLKKEKELPFTCKLKQRKRAVENSCEVKKDKTPCPCEKPMMTINCSKSQLPCSARNSKEIIQTKPSMNTVNTESDCKFSDPNTTYQECKSNSKCLKRSVKKTKSVESCNFPKEADDSNVINDDNCELKERKNRSTVLSAGGSSFNDDSNCDWTMMYSVKTISATIESDQARSCNVKCSSISSDRVAGVEPEDLPSAPQRCSCNCSVQQSAAVATPPRQSPRRPAVESVSEPPREHHHGRQSLDNRDGVNTELTTENGGRADAVIFGSGQRRTSPVGQMTNAPVVGRRVGQPCPAKNLKTRSCPAEFAISCRLPPSFAFTEYQPPTTPRRPDTLAAAAVSCLVRSPGSMQQQQLHQLQLQQQQQQQRQNESSGSSGDNRPDTVTWNPEVRGGYSAFSAAMRSRLSSRLPANDYQSAANNGHLLDDRSSDRRQSSWARIMWANRSSDVVDDDNDFGDATGSLSELTSSSDCSIELRRTDGPQHLLTNDDDYDDGGGDRYPSDGNSTPNLSDVDVSLQRVDAVSMPAMSITWPWTRSGPRVQEFGDVGAPEQYDHTSCSSDDGHTPFETDDDSMAPLEHRRN